MVEAAFSIGFILGMVTAFIILILYAVLLGNK
jgi:hypothetical protein